MPRWLKRLALGLGVLLLVVALALGALWAWVQSPSGEAWLQAQAESAAAEALVGKLTLSGLRLDGTAVTLSDLKLFTPEGELVAEVKTVRAEVDLWPLLGGVVRLRSVALETPRLLLVSDERGLNLSRAVEAKVPSPPDAPPTKLTIDVAEARIRDGFVSFDAEAQHLAFGALTLGGSARVVTSPLRVTSTLDVAAQGQAPLQAPLALHVEVTSPKNETLAVVLTSSFGDAALDGTLAWPALEGELKRAVLPVEVARAFVPSWPLQVPVSASGTVSPAASKLDLVAGRARLGVTAAYVLSPFSLTSADAEANEVDLSELLKGGKPSKLGFTAHAELSDLRPSSLTGALSLNGVWQTPTGQRLAAVDTRLTAEQGAVTVTKLSGGLPGASVSVTGTASMVRLNLAGRLEAPNLEKVAQTVAEFTGTRPLELAGAGTLAVDVGGSVRAPSVHAEGRFRGVRLPGASIEQLDADVTVPDVTKPLNAQGTLSARELLVSGRRVKQVTAQVTTHGRQLDAQLSTQGLGDMSVRLAGTLKDDASGAAIATAVANSGVDEWVLESPFTVLWADGNVSMTQVTLKAGRQRAAARAALRGNRVDAEVTVERLDLGRLPPLLVPAKLGLDGEVSAHVLVSGRTSDPEVAGDVTVIRGAFADAKDIDATARGTWRKGRAQGDASVGSPLGRVKAEFDVPVKALLDEKPEALRVVARLDAVRLDEVAALLKQDVPVKGMADLELTVDGLADAPKVTATVVASRLTVSVPGARAGAKPLEVERSSVSVSTGEGGQLALKASAQVLGGSVQAEVKTPLTVASLRKAPPDLAALMALSVETTWEVRSLDLSQLDGIGVLDDDELRGTAGFEAQMIGSIDAPEGTATVTVRRLRTRPFKDLDATVQVIATHTETRLEVTSALSRKPALTVHGAIAAPLARLLSPETLGTERLTLTGAVAPLTLQDVLLESTDSTDKTRGVFTATFDLSGTPNAPVSSLRGAVKELGFSNLGLGSARFEVASQKGQHLLSAAIGGLGRDDLKVKGSVGLDVSLPKLLAGLEVKAAPLDLSLDAKALDIAFLSGASSMVRRVAGKLTMQGTVRGTVGAPAFRGTAKWHEGRLGLLGYGDYRDIELDLTATNDVIDVSQLSLKAGVGWAKLKGKATRVRDDVFSLVAEGETNRLPIIYDDQLMASTSLRLTLVGDITPKLVDIRNLELPRVDVELPDVKRKDLQDLERPEDILVLRDGAPVSRRLRVEAQEAAKGAAVEASESRAWRFLINAPRNIWVKSSDVSIEVGLSENFRVEYADRMQMFGEAQVLRGRVDVIGRTFEVAKSSQVRFAGPAKLPYINGTAVHKNEAEQVKVTVTATGRGSDLAIKTSSEPPMSESEIYTLLATGRSTLKRGSGSSLTTDQATSILGSLAAAQLKTVIAKQVPIDVVSFDSVGDGSFRVEVGKYLTDTLYLGYQGQIGANTQRGENPHAGRVELQMSKKWSLEGYAGTAPAAGADFMWSTDF